MSKLLKRIFALTLALALVVSLAAACGSNETPTTTADPTSTPTPAPTATPTPAPAVEEAAPEPEPEPEPQPEPDPTPEPTPVPFNTNSKVPRDTFIAGTPAMNGDFISGFGNSSYDLSIKTLTGGFHETYYQTPEGQIALNQNVVQSVATSEDAEGNKTYTFTLYNDLKWNNGETIYARDYVASLLLYASPEIAAVGVTSSSGDGLVGYSDYKTFERELDEDENPVWSINKFAGARVLGDFQFSLTIDVEELPYFWETSYVAYGPVPLRYWLRGIEVESDESGSWFSDDITRWCERLSEVERYNPTVTCGPYKFISFDGSIVTLQRNPHFKGDYNGNKPSFEYIIQMEVPQETDVDMVISGDIDLNAGNIEGSKIEKAKASEYAVAHSYLRAGYGHLSFHIDFAPVDDANVRWAIAHMIDRNAIIDHVLEGYGGLVDAAFGMAQWTYQARRRELAQRLQSIAFNLDKANDFLDASAYVYEADGSTPFDRNKVDADGTYLRHNSDGKVLEINHISASFAVGGAIEGETIKNAPLVGMVYNITHGDFNTLLEHYYYPYTMGDDRFYHSFNLAVNFSAVDDKYWSYHSDLLNTWYNTAQMNDPEIDRLTEVMRKLDPTDTDTFADLWVDFQVRWQEILPQIPLYSNEYFDIYNSVVIDIPTTPYANYQDVICLIHKHP